MFSEHLLLVYCFRVENEENIVTCRLGRKIVKCIEIETLPGCYLDYICSCSFNCYYTLRLSSCENLIRMRMLK